MKKTNNYAKFGLAYLGIIALSLIAVESARAQYSADFATQTTLTPNDYGSRLFSGTTGAPGPAITPDSVVWFVSSSDGLFSPTGSGGSGPGGVLTANQLFILADKSDSPVTGGGYGNGTLVRDSDNGNPYAGIPEIHNLRQIQMYIWAGPGAVGANPASFIPGAGNTFDVFNLGVRPHPAAAGNAQWQMASSLFSGNFSVVAVPERSTFALAGLGLVGLLGYRRFKK